MRLYRGMLLSKGDVHSLHKHTNMLPSNSKFRVKRARFGWVYTDILPSNTVTLYRNRNGPRRGYRQVQSITDTTTVWKFTRAGWTCVYTILSSPLSTKSTRGLGGDTDISNTDALTPQKRSQVRRGYRQATTHHSILTWRKEVQSEGGIDNTESDTLSLQRLALGRTHKRVSQQQWY